ncbi:MAG: hypothetical protein AAGA88_05080 [Pseudomonadota bacterium]
MTETPETLDFIEGIDIDLPPGLEAVGGVENDPISIIPPNFFAGTEKTIVVGSQLAAFAASVDEAMRPHISNMFLLAQLAADKHIENTGGNSRSWYDFYVKTLKGMGWLVEGDANAVREVEGATLQVHQEIIPVITAALGPMAAAASTITTVLNGLANINKDAPWITLFHRKSQRAKANQFQISYATAEGGHPALTLVGFELEAETEVTQVLFFKFGASSASLKHFEVKISMAAATVDLIKDAIARKLGLLITQNIEDIEI